MNVAVAYPARLLSVVSYTWLCFHRYVLCRKCLLLVALTELQELGASLNSLDFLLQFAAEALVRI